MSRYPKIKNKKTLIKEFSNNKDLEKFIKNEDIDFNSEQDLIKIVEFINRNY